MKHPKSIRISIPTPCHEDWSKMTLQEQGRFCNSCHKCVVDFTGFTDEQLYNYLLAHKNERICGRVYTSQTNRAIQLPAQPQSTLYKWVIAAGLVLLSTAAPESKTFAQAPLTEQSVITSTQNSDNKDDKDTKSIVEGIIVNENKAPISGAVIKALNHQGMVIDSITSDYAGKFSITHLPIGNTILQVSHLDYKKNTVIFNSDKQTFIQIVLTTYDYIERLGEMTISAPEEMMEKGADERGNKIITSKELERSAY